MERPTVTAVGGAELAALLQRVTRLANESTDTDATLRLATDDIAATMSWPAGRVLLVDEDQATPAGDPSAATHGRIAFPVVSHDTTLAVLEFTLPQGASPSADVLDAMGAIGLQLGIVVERNRVRAELETAKTELERSNHELERFAYVSSHDLQEPLRKILGFSDLLEKRCGDELSDQATEYLHYVTDGARRMSQLIEDLLRYSRVGRRRPDLAPTDLAKVLDDVVELLATGIEEAGARIVVEDLPTVRGDADQLFSLFANLVGNALKYRGERAPEVTVRAAPDLSGWWDVTVSDNGIGIDPIHWERVFEVFQRLHPRTEYEGSGIGLAICRRIVEHHGGRIWVDSEPGQGATFHVTLPSAPGDTR